MTLKKGILGFTAAFMLLFFCTSIEAQQDKADKPPKPQREVKAPAQANVPPPRQVASKVPMLTEDYVKLEEIDGWHTDYDAVITSKENMDKDLFIYFNASDWGVWCQQVNREIFSNADFLDKIQKDYILIMLDRPKNNEPENLDRIVEIMERYRIASWPTVVLTTRTGKSYARSTFIRDEHDPAKYIEHYKLLKQRSIELDAAGERVKAAEGVEAIDAAYEHLMATLDACDKGTLEFRRNFSVEYPKSNEMLHRAFFEDPENKRSLKLKTALFLIRWGDVSETVCQAFEEMDPKNEHGYLEQLLETRVRESDLRSPQGGEKILPVIEQFYKDKTIQDQDRDMWIKFIAGHINYRLLGKFKEARGWFEKSIEKRCSIPNVTNTAKKYIQEIEAARIKALENKTDESEK